MGEYVALRDKDPFEVAGEPNWWVRTFRPLGPGSLRASILSLSSNAIGAGLLSVAYAVKLSGILLGTIFLVLGAVIFAFYYRIMTKAHDQVRVYTYVGMVKAMFGETWRRVLEICLTGLLFGILCAFQVIFSQYILDIAGIFYDLNGNYEFYRRLIILGVSLGVLTPLVIPKQLTSIRYASSICIIAILYIAVVLVVQLPFYLSHEVPEVYLFKVQGGTVDSLTLTIFAYTAMTGMPIVYQELQNRSYKRMTKVIDRSMGLSAILYICIGTVGYISLGETTPELITDRFYVFGGVDWYMIVAKFLIAVTLIAGVAINMNPLRIGVQQMFLGVQYAHNDFYFYLITYLALYTSTGIAILIPSAIKYFKFLGGLFVIPSSLLLPGMIYFKLETNPLKRFFMALLSLLLGLIGLYSAFSTLVS